MHCNAFQVIDELAALIHIVCLSYSHSCHTYDHSKLCNVMKEHITHTDLTNCQSCDCIPSKYLSGAVQGSLSWLSLFRLSRAARARFGTLEAAFFCALTACQFHLPFYASRTLPNTFAFIPVVLALSHWLDGTDTASIPPLLTATTAIFRSDMLIVLACISISMLFCRQINVSQLVLSGLLSAVAASACTVLLDSYFWGRWLWPELEVFWFNAVLGKCVTCPFNSVALHYQDCTNLWGMFIGCFVHAFQAGHSTKVVDMSYTTMCAERDPHL
jgi:hypothetical protein